MERSILPAEQLKEIQRPPREVVVAPWFKQGDLGFVFGPRGLGKTWYALHLGRKIAEGGSFGPWPVLRPRRVLYVDGEMAIDGLKVRDTALTSADAGGRMIYLQHEQMFDKSEAVLNLAHPNHQEALSTLCQKQSIEVLILDNLSCLFTGISENDADAWEAVLPWLLSFRRQRVAVVFIAHAGRNGCMRGTSRREDAAFWIIELTTPESEGEAGARFVCKFDKNRNATEADCPPIQFEFLQGENGKTDVKWAHVGALEKFRDLVQHGLTTATQIAQELGVSASRVSYLAKIGIKQGWLRKNGRDYELVKSSKAYWRPVRRGRERRAFDFPKAKAA